MDCGKVDRLRRERNGMGCVPAAYLSSGSGAKGERVCLALEWGADS